MRFLSIFQNASLVIGYLRKPELVQKMDTSSSRMLKLCKFEKSGFEMGDMCDMCDDVVFLSVVSGVVRLCFRGGWKNGFPIDSSWGASARNQVLLP